MDKYPEKMKCGRHQSATDLPIGSALCISCIQVEAFNACREAFLKAINDPKCPCAICKEDRNGK